MQNIAVVSVKMKPEIPDPYCQRFKIRDSSELILGGSAGRTVQPDVGEEQAQARKNLCT
jgi:hypothetical protein